MSDHWSEPGWKRRAATTLKAMPLVAALAGFAGCSATKPFSYLDSERWSRVEINTYDTTIVSVDGTTYPYRSRIMVDPGQHHIVFQTVSAAGFSYSPQKALDIDIQPCVRYWFEAKRTNALEQDFQPRVNHTEPIPGCTGPTLAPAPVPQAGEGTSTAFNSMQRNAESAAFLWSSSSEPLNRVKRGLRSEKSLVTASEPYFC